MSCYDDKKLTDDCRDVLDLETQVHFHNHGPNTLYYFHTFSHFLENEQTEASKQGKRLIEVIRMILTANQLIRRTTLTSTHLLLHRLLIVRKLKALLFVKISEQINGKAQLFSEAKDLIFPQNDLSSQDLENFAEAKDIFQNDGNDYAMNSNEDTAHHYSMEVDRNNSRTKKRGRPNI